MGWIYGRKDIECLTAPFRNCSTNLGQWYRGYKFLMDVNEDNLLFNLRIADKYGLVEVEVIIPAYYYYSGSSIIIIPVLKYVVSSHSRQKCDIMGRGRD